MKLKILVNLIHLRGRGLRVSVILIYPASHYVTGSDTIPTTINMIREELQERLEELHSQGKLVEYHRLKQRTEHDIEMIEETGFCQGIENYSRIIQRSLRVLPQLLCSIICQKTQLSL